MFIILIGVDVFDDTSTVSGAILQCKVEEAEMRHKELQRNLEVISKDTGFLWFPSHPNRKSSKPPTQTFGY